MLATVNVSTDFQHESRARTRVRLPPCEHREQPKCVLRNAACWSPGTLQTPGISSPYIPTMAPPSSRRQGSKPRGGTSAGIVDLDDCWGPPRPRIFSFSRLSPISRCGYFARIHPTLSHIHPPPSPFPTSTSLPYFS